MKDASILEIERLEYDGKFWLGAWDMGSSPKECLDNLRDAGLTGLPTIEELELMML